MYSNRTSSLTSVATVNGAREVGEEEEEGLLYFLEVAGLEQVANTLANMWITPMFLLLHRLRWQRARRRHSSFPGREVVHYYSVGMLDFHHKCILYIISVEHI